MRGLHTQLKDKWEIRYNLQIARFLLEGDALVWVGASFRWPVRLRRVPQVRSCPWVEGQSRRATITSEAALIAERIDFECLCVHDNALVRGST